MPWLMKSIFVGELILGFAFALVLFLSWLFEFLKVHFQTKKGR